MFVEIILGKYSGDGGGNLGGNIHSLGEMVLGTLSQDSNASCELISLKRKKNRIYYEVSPFCYF